MKNVGLIICVGIALMTASCGGGKYADARAALNRQVAAMDRFAGEVEKAGDSKQVVAALERFNQETAALVKVMPELQKKYPELADQKNPPSELKDVTEKMQKAASRFVQAMMKISREYGQDPEVKQALEKIQSNVSPPSR